MHQHLISGRGNTGTAIAILYTKIGKKIRNFRNRVYHNEPIAWSLSYLEDMHGEIHTVLGWLNRDLPTFTKPIDRFEEMLLKAQQELM